jgi:predicted O-methyltransferase YrrM
MQAAADLMSPSVRTATAADLPAGDYVSPGLQIVLPDACFPDLIVADRHGTDWPYLRREIPHNFLADRRQPRVGFLNRDEAQILYNSALPFTGQPALEIGCWLGWSACHLALAGVQLDVVDPLLARAEVRHSVERSLAAAQVLDRVNLVPGASPQAVRELARCHGRRWSLIFIDGNHDAPGPLHDAEACEALAADDALILFHDLASPDVAQGWDYFKRRGWQTCLYDTMQIMGAAWRGAARPVAHVPDPAVRWSRPAHLLQPAGTGAAAKPAASRPTATPPAPTTATTAAIDRSAVHAILGQLAPFVPNSAGALPSVFDQTLRAARQTLPALVQLARTLGAPPLPVTDIGALALEPAAAAAATALAALFRQHGSDKSTVHDYHLLYGRLLAQPQSIRGLLEIGLGTNNPAVVSNMGPGGRPGASLRALRDWLPAAAIYGADVDRGILFEEPRIRSFYVDQSAPDTLAALGQQIDGELDLIIDDGLHAPNANVNTLAFALTRVRPGGWVVIEDIAERALDAWQLVAALLPAGCSPQLIRARAGYLFVVQRPASFPPACRAS